MLFYTVKFPKIKFIFSVSGNIIDICRYFIILYVLFSNKILKLNLIFRQTDVHTNPYCREALLTIEITSCK